MLTLHVLMLRPACDGALAMMSASAGRCGNRVYAVRTDKRMGQRRA